MITLIALLLTQTANRTSAAASSPARLVLTARIERRDEHVRYHFTNDSTFDTAAFVPHFFDQTYDASNTWVVISE